MAEMNNAFGSAEQRLRSPVLNQTPISPSRLNVHTRCNLGARYR